MARKLKTFVTTIGFFEMAVAAPSMKAALDAWGVPQNLFHQGFAVETDDPKIVSAAMAQPGLVVKRAVGSKSAFSENPALPTSLPVKAKPPAQKPKKAAIPKRAAKALADRETARTQIAAFEKTHAKRERARAAAETKQAAAEARETRLREAARAKAQSALDAASARHETKLGALDRQRQAVERKIDAERERWRSEKAKLERRLRDAER